MGLSPDMLVDQLLTKHCAIQSQIEVGWSSPQTLPGPMLP